MKDALKKPNLKSKVQKVKAKFAAAYYGNPAKDMKIIAVVGKDGKATVAHFVAEILKGADPRVGVIGADEKGLTAGSLQRALSKSWRAGANHVIVAVELEDLRSGAFDGVPVYMVMMTDTLGDEANAEAAEKYEVVKNALFGAEPEFAVLDHDDPYFEFVEKYPTKKGSASYGKEKGADMWIGRSKLYKKGAEATLTQDGSSFEVATYVADENAASYMAAAATAGSLLGIDTDTIADGIANYEPANDK